MRPGLRVHATYDEAAAAVAALEAADAASQRSRGGLATVAENEEAGDSGDEEAGDSAAGSDDEGAPPASNMPSRGGHGFARHMCSCAAPSPEAPSAQTTVVFRDASTASWYCCRLQGWRADERQSGHRHGGALRTAALWRMMTRRLRRGCCARRPPRPTRTSSASSASS